MKITNNNIVQIEYSREEIEEIIKLHVISRYRYEGEVEIGFHQFIYQMLRSPNKPDQTPNLVVTITKELPNAN